MLQRIFPAQLKGHVRVPASKSLLHRELILQWLADGTTEVPTDAAEDVVHTAKALEALQSGGMVLACGMSGSTLRFLLPAAMALGRVGTVFTGAPRLLERPVPAPLPMERTATGIRVTGALHPGVYTLPAGETSQLISGLLMALPLLSAPSEIRLTGFKVSAPYVDMTLQVMEEHGVTVERIGNGFYIPAPQRYCPTPLITEGDWSAAAWYLAYNALTGRENVIVENLRRPSRQGDSAVESILMHASDTDVIDISPIPDLLPVLALRASLLEGHVTGFTHAGFLRGKESNRLAATRDILCAMGGSVAEEADGLIVRGTVRLYGGAAVDARGDHRMAMLAAFAGALAEKPILLYGGDSVGKSYPAFWRDYTALGGKVEVLEP